LVVVPLEPSVTVVPVPPNVSGEVIVLPLRLTEEVELRLTVNVPVHVPALKVRPPVPRVRVVAPASVVLALVS
jgi:hypothetical protein